MDDVIDNLLARCDAAFSKKREWDAIYDDIYDFVLPYRRTLTGEAGKARKNRLYDSTAVHSAFRFAGRMQMELTPPNTVWMEICPGPLFAGDEDALKRKLHKTNKVTMAALDTGEYHTSSLEMYMDLCAGTGVQFILEPDDDDEICNFVAAPFSEVAIESSSKGHVSGVYWKKKYSARDLWQTFPNLRGKMGEKIAEAAKDPKQSEDNELIHSVRYSPNQVKSRRWVYQMVLKNTKTVLQTSWSRYSPAIVPRYMKLPGEAAGRGPAMMALPNIRVANKTVELILQAAALAVFGIFLVTDDGLLDPDKAVIEPGAQWMVDSNASSAYGGRSVEQLNLPNNFSLAEIVLQDQRLQTKQTMLDDQMPPEAGAVRSPTEIVARERNHDLDIGIAFGRLNTEIILRTVQRVHEILQKQGLVDEDIVIDQKTVMVKPVSPMARAQKMAEVQAMVQTLEVAIGLGGVEMATLIYKVEEILLAIGELMGVPPDMLRSDIEREKLMEMTAQILAQAQAQADAAGQDGPVQQAVGAAA